MGIIYKDLLLTKEAFEQYSKQLREQNAKQHGMTLEEWDAAIANMQVVTSTTGSFK